MQKFFDFGLAAELFVRGKSYSVLIRIRFERLKIRHDQSRDKFALIRHDDALINIAIDRHFRFYLLRRDIFAVRGLKQILDAFRQKQFTIFHIARITRVKPAIGVEHLFRGRLLLIITRRDRISAQEDLVVRADLQLQSRQDLTHRTERTPFALTIIGNGSRRFRQSVTDHHIKSHSVGKFFHLGRNGSTGRREEVRAVQTQRLAEQFVDRPIIEFILHLQHHRRRPLLRSVVAPIAHTRLQRILHQTALHLGRSGNFILHALIDFLPESRYARHTRGTNLLHRL